MKKYLLSSLFIMSLLCSCLTNTINTPNQKVSLKWKIGDDEIISYKTIMNSIEPTYYSFEDLFDEIDNSESENYNILKEKFNKIYKAFIDSNLKTILYKENDIIQVKMITDFTDSVDTLDDDFIKSIISANDGIMLRGSINESGKIESFWVRNSQKNVLSMLFELPQNDISIGDSWPLNINFIENDQNFICENSKRVNVVTLIDIQKTKNDIIAILKYDILESVSGILNFELTQGVAIKHNIEINISLNAIAEFSIEKGRWLSYNGILESSMLGYNDSNIVQEISLIPD